MAEKLDRKQLKKPDEFQLVAGRAMGWAAAHKGVALGGAGAIVALALIIWGVTLLRNSREAKAGAELSEALELQARPIAGDGQTQPGQDAFASREEREKAIITSLEKVRADHSGTTAAQTALAELGFHKLKAGDAPGAQKDLQDFLDHSGKEHPLRPFAQESLGYALEAQNKLEEAKAAFGRLREAGLAARADYQAARLALIEGKPDARQQLERIASEYPKDLDVVREANERLELSSLPPLTPGEAAPKASDRPQAEKKPQGKKQK